MPLHFERVTADFITKWLAEDGIENFLLPVNSWDSDF